MSIELLNRTRKISKRLRFGASLRLDFNEFCEELSTLTEASCYVISAKGKVLGYSMGCEDSFDFPKKTGDEFSEKANEFFLQSISTKENFKISGLCQEKDADSYLGMLLPISLAGKRFGTVFIYRYDKPFELDDIILTEYCAAIVGMELKNEILIEEEETYSKELAAENAISALTEAESKAAVIVFEEINNGSGVVKTSLLSDKYHITRSIFINMLQKLMSAGVIETVSRGPKGTYVRVLNDAVLKRLAK